MYPRSNALCTKTTTKKLKKELEKCKKVYVGFIVTKKNIHRLSFSRSSLLFVVHNIIHESLLMTCNLQNLTIYFLEFIEWEKERNVSIKLMLREMIFLSCCLSLIYASFNSIGLVLFGMLLWCYWTQISLKGFLLGMCFKLLVLWFLMLVTCEGESFEKFWSCENPNYFLRWGSFSSGNIFLYVLIFKLERPQKWENLEKTI